MKSDVTVLDAPEKEDIDTADKDKDMEGANSPSVLTAAASRRRKASRVLLRRVESIEEK